MKVQRDHKKRLSCSYLLSYNKATQNDLEEMERGNLRKLPEEKWAGTERQQFLK